jgi:hypothetical protein
VVVEEEAAVVEAAAAVVEAAAAVVEEAAAEEADGEVSQPTFSLRLFLSFS